YRQHRSWAGRWQAGSDLLAQWLARRFGSFQRLPRPRQILVIVIILLTFVFSLNLSMTGQSSLALRNGTAFSQITADIVALVDQIKGVLIYNDEDRAKELLASADQRLAELQPKNRAQRQQADQLAAELDALNQQLQHITVVTPQLVGDLTKLADPTTTQATTVAWADGSVYTLNATDNALYGFHPTTGEFIAEGVTASAPKILLAAGEGGNILYYHSGNGLLRYGAAKRSFEEVLANFTGQEDLNALAYYNRRLYTLHPATNQIYRFGAAGSGFATPQPWLRGPADLQSAVSLAVDGEVYVLFSDGQIRRYASGRQQDFTVKSIEPAWNDPTKV
ncbi:MAG: hypothetical protein AAB817_00185, partial [Patescibacteria group bacterium]